MILAPNGKPVSTKRAVTLRVEITDKQAASTDAQRSTMNFILDVPDRAQVSKLLQTISHATMRRLDEIGFFAPQGAPSGSGGGESGQAPS